MRMIRRYVLLLPVLLIGTVAFPQIESKTNKAGLGLFYHYEGLLPSAAIEFSMTRKISLELSFGMWKKRGVSHAIFPSQLALRSQYAGAIELRYYLFLNHRYPLEGIALVGHWGHYRSRIRGIDNEYLGFKNFQTETGGGISGQYFIIPRLCVGLTGLVNYVWVTDYHLNSDGTIRFLGKRPGFIFMGFLQAGYSF